MKTDIVHDKPWEGNSCGAYTIFKDNDLFRMYYMAGSQVLKGEPEPHKGVLSKQKRIFPTLRIVLKDADLYSFQFKEK